MIPIISTPSYRGAPIRLRGAMLNPADMWRAAGRPEHRRPAKWLAFEETVRFRDPAQAHWTEPEEPVAAGNVLPGGTTARTDAAGACCRTPA